MILIPILGDQLTLENPALREVNRDQVLIVMAEVFDENHEKVSTRMRSAVFISAMRHFAEELRRDGWRLEYFKLGEHKFQTLAEVWAAVIARSRPGAIRACEPGDFRVEQMLKASSLAAHLPLTLLDDDHFLVSRADFSRWAGKSKQLRMEMFYRMMRKRLGILMQGDQPQGGQWNYDEDNRRSFPKSGPANLPKPLRFPADEVTRKAIADLARLLPNQYGQAEGFGWPVTRAQGLTALADFMAHRLASFGPTQDAMWRDEPFLFHSLLSAALNLKLINPREVIEQAVAAYERGDADLSSVEGFIRQILGWREFMRGVYWLDMPQMKAANHLQSFRSLPQWYWSADTRMQCQRQAISQTLEHGYAHHIQRLMVTGNFALLAGLAPEEVYQWYLAVYVDAVEWVELPNTAGMALYANGGRFASKPYIASGAYIKRMSNYCQGCQYDPAQRTGDRACPMTTLYWNFLDRHRDELNGNPRAALMMKNYQRIDTSELESIRRQAKQILSDLNKV